MIYQNKAAELLAAYGKHAGIEGLTLPETGCCRFTFGENLSIAVDYMPEADCFMLTAPIIELPANGRAEIYTDLMELNLFWEELACARFAIFRELGQVVLTRQLQLESISAKRFIIALESFAEAAGAWQENLSGLTASEDDETSGTFGRETVRV